METSQLSLNPFALMLNPAAVVLAMEQSERLSGLSSRICRPLDKPMGARPADPVQEEADSDIHTDFDTVFEGE